MTGTPRPRDPRATGPAASTPAILAILAVVVAAGTAALLAAASAEASPAPGPSGASIFERGELGPGQPVAAVVAGDVELAGKAVACSTCHGRSGLGSSEGRTWVPPVAGRILFAPRSSGRRSRPGYDRAALARALRDGIDASGAPLDSLMPRYRISEDAVDALAVHLESLSQGTAPGVASREIRFAVVTTPDADPAVAKATWQVLEAFARDKSVQNRAFVPWDRNYGTFRRWVLARWDLQGPPSSWGRQLDALYDAAPVFALLSGAGGAEWGPVHDFCERKRIPAFLPNVDAPPPASATGAYSVYFSLGVGLEASAISAELESDGEPYSVLQLVGGDARALAGAAALRLRLPPSCEEEEEDDDPGLPPGSTPGHHARSARHRASPHAQAAKRKRAAVLWLGSEEAATALVRLAERGPWDRILISSTLESGDARGPPLPPGLGAAVVQVVHPFSEPSDLARRLPRLLTWLRSKGLAEDEPRVRDQALTACMVVGDALMHALTQIDREYVLELVDHGGNAPSLSAYHARLAFGPGERVLEKSVYLVAVGPDAPAPRRLVP